MTRSPRPSAALLLCVAWVVALAIQACNFDADYQRCITTGRCESDASNPGPDGSIQDAGMDGGSDAGSRDAGGVDAGLPDAGARDGGGSDAGTDSGTPDAGDGGCNQAQGSCAAPAQCCTGITCGPGNVCCQPRGGPCAVAADCCSGTCRGNLTCN